MPPIIALDFENQAIATRFLAQFPATEPLVVKIGMELFYREGPQVVRAIQKRPQTQIFLDLKLHDIPHTVEQAARQIGRLGVQLTTAHAAGGSAMLAAAKRGLIAGAAEVGLKPAQLLAITQLTSTNQQMLTQELQINGAVIDSVTHLAALAQTSGADGVVASAQEANAIRQAVGTDFLIVTPGIRPANSQQDDQSRVVTPEAARQLGSSAIVVGRPITQAPEPVTAYQHILSAWEEAK